jgi:hypothetical protein
VTVREATAYHEASHAVVALALGFHVTSVTIEASHEYGGCVRMSAGTTGGTSAREADVIVRFAGLIGERIHNPDSFWGATGDAQQIRLVRATYNRTAKLDRSLPVRLPTSAVEFNDEEASQKALDFKHYRKWFAAWRMLQSAVHRAYHLTGLLCGARPGELSRVKWTDLKPSQRCLMIGNAKAGNAISIPLSWPMVRALKIARDEARATGSNLEFIFPGTSQAARDELPARGNMLRHAFKTLCTDLKVDDTISSLLMGHALDGVSKKYISKIIITSGPALRSEQARISRRIVQLLGLTSTTFIGELAKPPLPAPPRERKPTKPRGPRKRENRSEYFKTWYAKNQARIIEKRRAERATQPGKRPKSPRRRARALLKKPIRWSLGVF